MSFFTGPDNRAFVDTTLWAETALVNGALEVPGMLDEQYADPLGMSAATPAFTCLTEDWAARRGDVLDIGGRRWIVEAVEPDGTGFQVCRLKGVN